MATIAFLGLGVMGAPMAGWLVSAGHAVRGWNRSPARGQAWATAADGRHLALSLEEAVTGADVAIACVGDDPDALSVGRAALAVLAPGSLYVDHTTTSAHVARTLSDEAAARGIGFVDAPVSGGEAGAVNGRLTAMLGGQDAAVARARDILGAYCATVVPIGPAGSGQLAKMANQIAIAGVVQGLAESMAFCEAAGLPLDPVFEAISKGAAGSWQMNNRWATMAQGSFDFGFAVDWMRKDLRIVQEQAAASGVTLPVTTMVDGFYGEVQAMGGARWDTSSLVARMRARRV